VSFYKFKRGDILLNTLTARPEYNFFIYDQNRYINNKDVISGSYSLNDTNVPPGYVNLYELNVNRASNDLSYPWIYSSENKWLRLSNLSSGSQINLPPGTKIKGSYPLSSSIQNYWFSGSDTSTKLRLESIRNIVNYYKYVGPHNIFSGSIPEGSGWRTRDLNREDVRMVTIPAIIHGGGIKEGTVSLKYYVSGTLQAQLVDENRRGELKQVSGAISANDGKVAGIVLYKEGIILLTGSWALNTYHTENYGPFTDSPRWKYFASTLSGSGISTPSSSYALDFKATEKIPNLTMLTYANRGELNYSNNPTFISASATNVPSTGSLGYYEKEDRTVKNIVSSSFTQTSGSFEKITYISKIGIYDKYKNLIGIANMANPVRKREQDSYTFKLKIDL